MGLLHDPSGRHGNVIAKCGETFAQQELSASTSGLQLKTGVTFWGQQDMQFDGLACVLDAGAMPFPVCLELATSTRQSRQTDMIMRQLEERLK